MMAICRVVGIRNAKLKMHDESVIELKHVRHVLDLKRNMISLDMIDQIRSIIRVQNGVLSKMKESQVLLKGIKKNGLYVFKGTVVTGEVYVPSSSSVYKTKLCHLII